MRGAGEVTSGNFRYELTRRWESAKFTNDPDTVVWCMLNPSTASAYEDDPTLRRCIEFSRLWGYNALRVVNLYALRTTDPARLRQLNYPIGLDNWKWLDSATRHANSARVLLAWGSHVHSTVYARAVAHVLSGNIGAYVLGYNKDGQPKHPLYLKKDLRPRICLPHQIGEPQ